MIRRQSRYPLATGPDTWILKSNSFSSRKADSRLDESSQRQSQARSRFMTSPTASNAQFSLVLAAPDGSGSNRNDSWEHVEDNVGALGRGPRMIGTGESCMSSNIIFRLFLGETVRLRRVGRSKGVRLLWRSSRCPSSIVSGLLLGQ